GAGIRTGGDVTLSAHDTSQISSTAQAASLAGAVGSISGSIAIGVAIANNDIANDVEAFVKNAIVSTTVGDVSIDAIQDATSTTVDPTVQAYTTGSTINARSLTSQSYGSGVDLPTGVGSNAGDLFELLPAPQLYQWTVDPALTTSGTTFPNPAGVARNHFFE